MGNSMQKFAKTFGNSWVLFLPQTFLGDRKKFLVLAHVLICRLTIAVYAVRPRSSGILFSSNNVGLARYPDNWNRKYTERNYFQSECQQCKQRWPCAVLQGRNEARWRPRQETSLAPHVPSWGLSEVNVLDWWKYLWHCHQH